jgi:hypothetical protein
MLRPVEDHCAHAKPDGTIGFRRSFGTNLAALVPTLSAIPKLRRHIYQNGCEKNVIGTL